MEKPAKETVGLVARKQSLRAADRNNFNNRLSPNLLLRGHEIAS